MKTPVIFQALAALGLCALLVGCGDKRAAQVPPATQNATSNATLDAAKVDIQNGQPAAAQARLEPWLKAHPDHVNAAYGHYLLGMALYEQKEFELAKKSLDKAKDMARNLPSETEDKKLRGLARLAIADCDMELGHFRAASRQYHWLEVNYREIKEVSHEEVLFKTGLATKKAGFSDTADYWFSRVMELYATGSYADEARRLHSRYGPGEDGEPTYYALEVAQYTDEAKALNDAELYRQKGYRDVKIHHKDVAGDDYYSVRIGKYDNVNSVKRAREDAEMAGLKVEIRPGLVSRAK